MEEWPVNNYLQYEGTYFKIRGKIYSLNLEARVNNFTAITGNDTGEKRKCLSLGCHTKTIVDWVAYKQQTFISQSSRVWEVQEQGARQFTVW